MKELNIGDLIVIPSKGPMLIVAKKPFRRFEYTEGSSNKFWEIWIDGSRYVVRYGRFGSEGQSQTKSFGSNEKAIQEHDSIIREKINKGYKEINNPDNPRVLYVFNNPSKIGGKGWISSSDLDSWIKKENGSIHRKKTT